MTRNCPRLYPYICHYSDLHPLTPTQLHFNVADVIIPSSLS